MGVAAARMGLDVLLVELEGYSNLGRLFGRADLDYDEVILEEGDGGGRLRARRITPDEALADYLDHSGLRVVTNRLARTGAVEVVTAAAPGIRDLLALGKIRQLEQRGEADLIVVDAPASGHARTFLQAPAGLAATSSAGPVRHQADLALELLGDEHRCRVTLVTLPEETPVTETVETAYELEDRVGVKLGPVVVNGCWPAVDGLAAAVARVDGTGAGSVTGSRRSRLGPPRAVDAARYRLGRVAGQRAEIERLTRELPLPAVELPFLFTSDLSRPHLDALAAAL